MEDICFFIERSWSKMIPRFLAESVGVRGVPLKIKDDEVSFARCCQVPMTRYSVLEGLTDRRLVVSQV